VKGTTARGYGSRHQAERRRWEPIVAAGEAICARCDKPIDPTGPFDLGHNEDRTAWTGPEHVKCNRSAGGKNAAAITNEKKQTLRWDW
jgi:hypothetical protein